jgi:branched-chain amino acid aminotransferase
VTRIEETLRAFRSRNSSQHASSAEAYVRLIVSRGIGKIGFGKNCVLSPTQYVLIVQPLEPPTDAQFQAGLKMQISKRLRNDPRALDPAMKSGNYLNSLLAFLSGAEDGFDDALMCNSDGFLTEGTTFNLFYVKRGVLVTPPLEIGILDGITRRKVLQIAARLGIDARETRFPRERLYEADEVFLTSTIKEVFPITQVDDRKIGKGPGPLTRRLREEFGKLVAQEMMSQAEAS